MRTYHILRALAEAFQVHLVCHEAPRGFAQEGLEQIKRFCRVTTVPEPPVTKRLVRNIMSRGLGCPGFLLKNRSEPILRTARALADKHLPDAIHWNMLDTACFALEHKWQVPMVFDSHNCLWYMAEQVAERGKGLRRWLFARESRLLKKIEGAVCQKMAVTLTCSDRDAELFQQVAPEARFATIPNGVDTDYFYPCPEEEKPGQLVFTGSMSYFPNVEAAKYFVESILPLVVERCPGVRVFFVGANPTKEVRSLHDGQRVFVTGRVDDVRPYVWQSQVFIVPLLTGGGTRLKVLEALAMGKAVVSTTRGAEGLDVEHGKHLLIADSPVEFAESVARVVEDQQLRFNLGANGRTLVENAYSWQSVTEKLLAEYRQVYNACAGRV